MIRHSGTLLLAFVVAILCGAPALAQDPEPSGEDELGRLITQTAKQGSLKPAKGKRNFILRLHGAAPQVVWFDDRPERATGQIPVGRFVRSWARFGFEEIPPNAALTLLDADEDQDTIVLELGKPRYNRERQTVRFPARTLGEATGNISHLEPGRDRRIPRRFRAASLFIDDAGYGLPAGCQRGLPYITCAYTSSTKLSFDSIASEIGSALGRQLEPETPVWVQAWGGRGARGASGGGGKGAYGGYAGYAMSVQAVESLRSQTLYVYVGASGSRHANRSGQGGASSVVAVQPISQFNSFPGPLVVLAGGSGGGGQGSFGADQCDFDRGGSGGLAIGAETLIGGGDGDRKAGGGAGGSGGRGGADGGGASNPGADGAGGYGGASNPGGSTAGWLNVGAVDPAAASWPTGAGGKGGGGGGGGGYGGGGGGQRCAGGGGGGSFSEGHYVQDPGAPTNDKRTDGVQSKVVLTFNFS